MGFAKNEMMEWEDKGLTQGEEGNVCANCIGDPVLSRFISENASESNCDYCEQTQDVPFACTLSDVAGQMADVITEDWADAVTELPYDGDEGGFQGETLDGRELLEEIGFEPNSDDLFEDLASYFDGREWCRQDHLALTPYERLRFGWQRFCRVVSHQRRFTFWTDLSDDQSEYHPDYLPPGIVLAEIQEVIQRIGLIKEFPKGTTYWRAADHSPSEKLAVPSRFTSPPVQYALQPNRMSPAGIPMFYGADNFETAVIEVCGIEAIPDRAVSAVQFQACRPLWLLDLSYLAERVSYFAENGRDAWHRSAFLRYFARDISKPIERDKRQHIDYVPTQVLTEYVRYHMQTQGGNSIDGIRYLSSRNHQPCVVLFFDQDDCLAGRDVKPQSLDCTLSSLRTIRLDVPRSIA